MATALAVELRRLGVAGERVETRALLTVEGINAHLHGTLLHPPPGTSTGLIVEELVDLWVAALSPARPHRTSERQDQQDPAI